MVHLYLDENVDVLLAKLLRAKAITVTTALENKTLGWDDEPQLELATRLGAAIVTHNRDDFEDLYRRYLELGKTHQGIIILIRRNVYEMGRRLARLALAHDDMANQLWYV